MELTELEKEIVYGCQRDEALAKYVAPRILDAARKQLDAERKNQEFATFSRDEFDMEIEEAEERGKRIAQKNLPSWHKPSKTIGVDMDKYILFKDALMSPDGWVIELEELEKLPHNE